MGQRCWNWWCGPAGAVTPSPPACKELIQPIPSSELPYLATVRKAISEITFGWSIPWYPGEHADQTSLYWALIAVCLSVQQPVTYPR